MPKKMVFLCVLVISALTLQLELLQTRLLSFVLWHHFVYVVVTMALLGFAASGTVLSLSARLKKLGDSAFFIFCFLGFSITSYFASRFAFLPIRDTFSLTPEPGLIGRLIIVYTLYMLPYFFSGLAIGGALMRFPGITGLLYFSNLLGSGLGCVLFILLIGSLGGPKLLLFSSFLALLPLIPAIKTHPRAKLITVPWLLFLMIGLFVPENSWLHRIEPERHKQFWGMYKNKTRLEYTEWNPISRVDVISNVDNPRMKNILMDGDAQAMLAEPTLVEWATQKSLVDRNAAYTLLEKASAHTLIIGAGGGFDVITAALNGSLKIDAVELNPTTAKITSSRYSAHLGDIFLYPQVKLFTEDGRSFVRRSKNQYDVIMIYATDTLLAVSTGAYVMADNYLYTKEAFLDYLDHISDNGLIQIGRWYSQKTPRETLRIFSTALTACREKGYKDPLSHVAVFTLGELWGDVILKKTPFTAQEKKRLKEFCAGRKLKILYPAELSGADKEAALPFTKLAQDFASGKEADFYRAYDSNVYPVTDDSPFFYQYNKWQGGKNQGASHDYYDRIRGVWHIFVLSSLLLHAVLLSLVLVLLPLFIARRNTAFSGNRLFTAVFFASIGFAFMLLEMGIMQKFALTLGHPIYSMAVVISGVLIFAGIGSLVSGKIKRDPKLYLCAATLVCALLILLVNALLPWITKQLLPQTLPVRIAATFAVIAPLAFFMGMPFPLALKCLSHKPQAFPWAWAVNGSASVIASVIAVIIAMGSGFRAVLNTGAAFYALAFLAALLFLFKKMKETGQD